MKKILLTLGVLALSLPVAQAQYDDIYYNPDKPSASRTTQTKKQKQQKKSNYIADFSNMDVDEYNRVGDMYYATPVDTIGTAVENGQDFVYTQQIQKYYNPTIVLDNADLLEDVLNNSYGNVEVVINNNGVPVFSPYYSSVYYNYPFYASWNWGPSWTWTWGPSWTWHWGWGPSWAWGPSWTWGPSWSWGWRPGYYPGWGPSWSWGPGYYPGGWHRPFHADYRPGAHRPTAPRPGWSGNRPRGGNYHGQLAGRPTRGDRYNSPGNGSLTTNRRQYAGNRRGYTDASNSAAISGNRLSTNRSQRVERNLNNANRLQSGTSTSQGTTPNRNYGTSTNRSNRTFNSTNSTSSNRNSYNTNRSTTNRNSYNTNRNSYNNTNRSSYNRSNNSSSYNRSSSYGSSSRSYGGGSRSYGGGGRSGGGHRR